MLSLEDYLITFPSSAFLVFKLELKTVPLLIWFTFNLWISPQKSSIKCLNNFFIWSWFFYLIFKHILSSEHLTCWDIWPSTKTESLCSLGLLYNYHMDTSFFAIVLGIFFICLLYEISYFLGHSSICSFPCFNRNYH